MRVALKVFTSIIFLLLTFGCHSAEEKDFKFAQELLNKKDFKEALMYFDRAILRNPESRVAIKAAREGAKVALLELKDFKKTIEFNKYLVLYSKDTSERLSSQRQISLIYFENLNDYENAIIELNKLLAITNEPNEKDKLKVYLAKSYYYLNNFVQAESEANEFLKNASSSEDFRFQMLVLKGNIYLAKKEISKATFVFKEVLDKYTEKATKENVGSILSVAYEEMKDYKNAILVLEQIKKYHPMPEYIDLRIKKLNESQKNQPGAKGLRRK